MPKALGGSEWNHYSPFPKSHFLLHIKLAFSAQHFLAEWWGKSVFLFLSWNGYHLKLKYQNQTAAAANRAKRTFLSCQRTSCTDTEWWEKENSNPLGMFTVFAVLGFRFVKTPTPRDIFLWARERITLRPTPSIDRSLGSLSSRRKNCVSKRKRCQWRFVWRGRRNFT